MSPTQSEKDDGRTGGLAEAVPDRGALQRGGLTAGPNLESH